MTRSLSTVNLPTPFPFPINQCPLLPRSFIRAEAPQDEGVLVTTVMLQYSQYLISPFLTVLCQKDSSGNYCMASSSSNTTSMPPWTVIKMPCKRFLHWMQMSLLRRASHSLACNSTLVDFVVHAL